jgi:hypothetical protein
VLPAATRAAVTATDETKLVGSAGSAQDIFGWSVAVDGDTAVVSAPLEDNVRGRVYVTAASSTS